jgi:phosphoribosylformimino-5-aminoimidazole carboxamide ribotide isomerase
VELIGVVDIMAGRAVRGGGGVRERYTPIEQLGDARINGDPAALARAYVEYFTLSALYAADLDAITGGDMQAEIVRNLAATAPLWLDAGVWSLPEAQHVIDQGASRVVVGLETLQSFEGLASICTGVGGAAVVFSLDLWNGEPVAPRGLQLHEPPHDIASRAADAGADTVIVIDLARVGAATGPDFDLLTRVRRAVPRAALLAGGGIRGFDDVTRLADVGCDGALVASALQSGALSAADVRRARRLERHDNATR